MLLCVERRRRRQTRWAPCGPCQQLSLAAGCTPLRVSCRHSVGLARWRRRQAAAAARFVCTRGATFHRLPCNLRAGIYTDVAHLIPWIQDSIKVLTGGAGSARGEFVLSTASLVPRRDASCLRARPQEPVPARHPVSPSKPTSVCPLRPRTMLQWMLRPACTALTARRPY